LSYSNENYSPKAINKNNLDDTKTLSPQPRVYKNILSIHHQISSTKNLAIPTTHKPNRKNINNTPRALS
jgi:hypothetical protein